MKFATKDALLGASDLIEREVDLPTVGLRVKVRSLAAAYSNQAITDAMDIVQTEHRGREQRTTKLDTNKLETLKVLHGLVDPKLSTLEEAAAFQQHCGPAWHQVVKAIDEISGIDQEATDRTDATFRDGVLGQAGQAIGADVGSGNGQSDVPVRTGA